MVKKEKVQNKGLANKSSANDRYIRFYTGSFSDKYGWNFIQKMIAWTLFIVIIWFSLSYLKFDVPKGEMEHGFKYLGVAPENDNPFFEKKPIPSASDESDEMINYAMELYYAGNMGMLQSDYSGIFLSGYSNSTTLGMDIPLVIEAVELRDNLKGEYTKYRTQVCNTEKADNATVLIGKVGAELAEIRHYVAGDEKVTYYKTTAFYQDSSYEPDWSKRTGASVYREDIYTTPTALTSAATVTLPKDIELEGYRYVLIDGKYYPYYINKGGIEMSYEITDQHFAWLENSASVIGEEFEADFFKTIKSATVEHNEGGYYEVSLVMDVNKEYSTYDTIWAIQDEEGANSKNAHYKVIELKFQLWDNGYFKMAELTEAWECKKAKPMGGVLTVDMKADQKYTMQFTYNKSDCDNTRFRFWE